MKGKREQREMKKRAGEPDKRLYTQVIAFCTSSFCLRLTFAYMHIKGTLIAIGGNEAKSLRHRPVHAQDTVHDFMTSGILYRIIAEIKNPNAFIEVITTASSIPEEVGSRYQRAFRKLGYPNVRLMHPTLHEHVDQPECLARIATAGAVLFSGGDQFKLTTVFRETAFAALLHERYVNEQFVIAGTSAGAMAMTDLMLYPGADPLKPDVLLYPGLSLIHNAIIDTHFLVRGRFRRLALAVANNPTHIGIGLEEDTGIIVRKGSSVDVIGSGLVTIIDGRSQDNPNQTVERANHDIFIQNLLVHILMHGNNFTLRDKKLS